MVRRNRSIEAPTVEEVAVRQKAESQPPRFWCRRIKPDGHGNERSVVELRVMDGDIYARLQSGDGFYRWTMLDAEDWHGCEWADCFPPPNRGV